MLETDRLFLKLLDQDDEESIVEWRNKTDIINNLFSFRGITLAEHRKWFERYISDNSRLEFVIVKKGERKKIGTIGLSSIDRANQKAEYGIMIGENDERGKGYAKEASLAMMKFGFNQMNLNKIYLKVFSDNNNAINLYSSLGFVREGILKEDIFKNGKYKDVIIMAAFRDSWSMKYEQDSNKS